jgi:hypothetical protein
MNDVTIMYLCYGEGFQDEDNIFMMYEMKIFNVTIRWKIDNVLNAL